ncbi:MAG: hypothetical protein ABI614_09110 [Planctomycetota bacterium]
MQFRIRVPIVFGLLMVCCVSSASAQINALPGSCCRSYSDTEPYYDVDRLTTGCYRDTGPCWLGQSSIDLLLLGRSDADSRTIVTEAGTGNPLLNTADLGFPVAAGFRANLVLPGANGCDLVFNYLGAKFDNSRVNSAATARYDFFEFPALAPSAGTSFQTSYTSTLNSVEVNGRLRQWCRFAPLAGFRFIQLGDEFNRLSGDGTSDLLLSTTGNQLWGFQIGGEALLCDWGAFRLQSTTKAGVFVNHLTLDTGGGSITVPMFDPMASFSTNHAAFFGEVNLELAYRVGPHFSIRVGGTAMWLDGVALAPDQHDNFNLQTQVGTFDFGTVMYYGGYLGGEFTW